MGEESRICGIVLAAGAGTRFGGPKALARTLDGRSWVELAVDAVRDGGCAEVVVVLGSKADATAPLVPAGARAVIATDWAHGLSHSVRVGLEAAAGAEAVVIVPVDTPELPASAVARVIAAADDLAGALVRAEYDGHPGHPALVGVAHWPALVDGLVGDVGAGPFLSRHAAARVECADLWSGRDHDRP